MNGEKIKEFRKLRGLTQKKLGELCEPPIAEPTIRKYELGLLNPKVETIKRIASALNVSVSELMDWSEFDERFPNVSEEVKLIEVIENQYGNGAGKLLYLYSALNTDGKKRAIDSLEDLSMVEKYAVKK